MGCCFGTAGVGMPGRTFDCRVALSGTRRLLQQLVSARFPIRPGRPHGPVPADETTGAEGSALWRRAFGDQGRNRSVSRLVESLRQIRKGIEPLASRIADSLPGLTIHDISHLDALWDVAGTVVGPNYPVNPLEAYVFGASVLLHDAGLCFEAYSGGQEAVRDTVEWRDAHRRLSRTPAGVPNLEQEADFEALRVLHPRQAVQLAVKPLAGRDENQYIIDDVELRDSYGQLIGELAASHHWNLDQVASRFVHLRPAAPFLGTDWTVDSLKVACMLRVADAGHMDGARAPSHLLRALQMNSVSRDHWRAQNRLGKLTTRRADPTQLMVASMSPFPREEAAAWWVAFDLVETFDRELRHCNEVLAASAESRPRFEGRGVAGAGRARELVKYIETKGWEPTDSTLHVSDVAALVAKLGGEQLYGKDVDRLSVALRELIQNAADAISARRFYEASKFEGCIYVRLRRCTDGSWMLQVDDDGVGMAKSTLATDLLDFGRSFWTSTRAAREFPGLQASGYTPIGRFGIGFFSIFMAAANVKVYSRRFDKGLGDVRCLSFDKGLSLRPTLSSEKPDDLGMDVCTRVDVRLKPGVVQDPDQMAVRCSIQGHKDLAVRFEDYVAAMVAGIDVPVFVERANGRRKVQERFPPEASERETWLRNLSYLNAGVNHSANVGLTRALPRLREIRSDQRCYGLAAIDVLGLHGGVFLSGKAVGGLVNPHARYEESFVGLIEHLPATAQRAPGDIAAPPESLDLWMSEQIGLLKAANLSGEESLRASYSICDFGFDPIEVLGGLFLSSESELTFMPLGSIANNLKNGLRLGFPVSHSIEHHLDSHSGQLKIRGFWTCVVIRNGKFNEAMLSSGVPSEQNSLIGVVQRVLVAAGESPTWSRNENVYFHDLLGQGDLLEVSLQQPKADV